MGQDSMAQCFQNFFAELGVPPSGNTFSAKKNRYHVKNPLLLLLLLLLTLRKAIFIHI
jgi:hypothetical protein